MKIIQILFISSMILITIKSACTPDEEDLIKLSKIRDYDDCEKRTSTTELKESGAYKCCYLYYIVDSNNYKAKVHTCKLITQKEFDNIKDTVNRYESDNKVEDVKIKCNSSFIYLGLLYLLLLIIL